jgi:quercetin dioxygenase-like cupin family protein
MKKKTNEQSKANVVVLAPGEGRSYPMGRISSVFKADGTETGNRYSVSEWWLEANTKGPGLHSHPEDDLFYVIDGVMSICVDGRWINAPKGSFILAPGGIQHDFENRSDRRAGVLNFSIPGNFEVEMPEIVKWFMANPPEDARP